MGDALGEIRDYPEIYIQDNTIQKNISNNQLKNGEVPKSLEDNSNKKAQKDTDAGCTQ